MIQTAMRSFTIIMQRGFLSNSQIVLFDQILIFHIALYIFKSLHKAGQAVFVQIAADDDQVVRVLPGLFRVGLPPLIPMGRQVDK